MLQTSITFVEVIKLTPSIFLLHFHIKGFISSSFLYVQMANKIARSGDDSRDEMTFNKMQKAKLGQSFLLFFFVSLYKHAKRFVGGKYLWILRPPLLRQRKVTLLLMAERIFVLM